MKRQWSVRVFNGISEENLSAYVYEFVYSKNEKTSTRLLTLAKRCKGKQLEYKDGEISVDFLAIFPSSFLSIAMSGPVSKL